MDKTYRTELFRLFLVEALPSPLIPASSHIQLFDNYIANTRLRLRSIRIPESKKWSYLLQQRFRADQAEISSWKTAEIHLNDEEHALFGPFEGHEIRKNRYFHEFDGRMFTFDIYLGPLWGINRARVDFQSADELLLFQPPPFAIFEVTEDPFFDDGNLIYKKFDDVRKAVANLGPLDPHLPDE